MKVLQALSNWKQKRNRIAARINTWRENTILFAQVKCIYFAASLINLIRKGHQRYIERDTFAIPNSDHKIVINCMGNVDEMEELAGYERDLRSISALLKKAHLSFAAVRGEGELAAVNGLLAKHGVSCVSSQENYITARLYASREGNVAVIFYHRYDPASRKKHIKMELTRYMLTLRKMGAEYIVVYVGNRRKGTADIGTREARLYRMLGQLGADYIVGITPNLRNSGTTYKAGERTARSIYSLGTFLSTDSRLSNKRIVIRLKLRRIQGRLQLFEETYFPYYKTKRYGFVSLVLGNPRALSEENHRRYLAEIEHEMRRIRPVNRLLTVGKMMRLIGEPLPEPYAYLKDFSVGKVCARSFEVNPGDVFFFRQPFEDANDLEPVNPRQRLRIVKKSCKRGAMLIISYQNIPVTCPYIPVADAMEAHIAVCAYLRKQFDIRAIGITGSIGKTSTKDMLAEVMKMKYNTLKSERNSNVQIKIGISIQNLDSSCQVYIQEIGGGRPGGASRHSRMVLPEATVVTNIGDAHIGNFGSQEKLMENKLGITEGMPEDGVLYLNGDDPLLSTAKRRGRTVFYAVRNRNADYYVENMREGINSTTFRIVHGSQKTPVKLNVLGEYNVLNAVCCFAIGEHFGIPQAEIVKGLANFRTSGIRQNLVQVCGRKLFMDCYNASSESVKSSMEVLEKIKIAPDRKRIAVIGDITGMGELADEVHRNMAETLIQHPVGQFIFFGTNVHHTYEVVKAQGLPCAYASERGQLNALLMEHVDVGDVVLFKGSSKVLLEQSADMVYGTRFTDQRFLDAVEFKRVRRGVLTYNLFGNYSTLAKCKPGRETVKVAAKIGGIQVVNIGKAFKDTNVSSVALPGSIRHLASEAFMNCSAMTEFHLPSQLKFIGNGTFRNCLGLRELKLPEGVLHIGAEAFQGCRELHTVQIPASVVQIGKNAFQGCDQLTIYCRENSFAARYMEQKEMKYEIY